LYFDEVFSARRGKDCFSKADIQLEVNKQWDDLPEDEKEKLVIFLDHAVQMQLRVTLHFIIFYLYKMFTKKSWT
jgi:hypothetical protein